jgi:hypothetical protein
MAAVQSEARITAGAPDFRSDPIRRASFGDTGEVTAGKTGQHRPFHLPGVILHIARVHGCSVDPYDCPTAPRLRVRQVYQGKLSGWIAESLELQCAHGPTALHSLP